MECESPSSSSQLRAAAPSAQVSLGYTRAQVHAPLPHSGSWTGERNDGDVTSPQQRRNSTNRHSYVAASPPHSISSQLQPNALIRPQGGVAEVMVDAGMARGEQLSGGGGGVVVQQQTLLLPAVPPEATQSGSMNLPLYHHVSSQPHIFQPPHGVLPQQQHVTSSSQPHPVPPSQHHTHGHPSIQIAHVTSSQHGAPAAVTTHHGYVVSQAQQQQQQAASLPFN